MSTLLEQAVSLLSKMADHILKEHSTATMSKAELEEWLDEVERLEKAYLERQSGGDK